MKVSFPPARRRRTQPVPRWAACLQRGTKMLCSRERELGLGSGLHRAGPQDVGFPSPPEPRGPSCCRFRRGCADLRPGPRPRVDSDAPGSLCPCRTWHLAPCSLAAQTVGRDALSIAATLGSPRGNSGLLHPATQLAARRPRPWSRAPSCPGALLPANPEPLVWPRSSGSGHPQLPLWALCLV